MLEVKGKFRVYIHPITGFAAAQTNRRANGNGIWVDFFKEHFLAENSVGFTNTFYAGQ